MSKNIRFLQISVLFLLVVLISSCGSIKNYKYFEDIPDSLSIKNITTTQYIEPKIQTDDILYIAIQTVDPAAGTTINTLNAQSATSSLVNNSGTSTSMAGSQSATYGYLVDKQGFVTLPIIGNVKLVGLTTQEARILLTEKASKFYITPTIIIRYANFKITVLGEVTRPGSYTIPNEKLSVLDAIGYAGDLTIYGKRDNILLFRPQADGTTLAVRLNLTKSSTFQSPYFYLQQNDQLYVEPSKAKINSSDGTLIRNISIGSAVLSFIVVLVSQLSR